jgi:hypothetical protein
MMRDPMSDPNGRIVDAPSIKVVYITGSGRSGSTLLCQILGEYDGFFCGGELSDFWDRYLAENRLCACGVDFRSCKVWSRIVKIGMPNVSPSDALEVAKLHMRVGRTQHLPFLRLPPLRSLFQRRLTSYAAHLRMLYRAILAGTGCEVIVDSSKFPSYGWILGQVPGIELYAIHLVRDPRAVAYSWARRRPPTRMGQRIETPRFGPASSSIRWITRNVLAEGLWRHDPEHYLLLRYEDFVTDPGAAVEQILELVGKRPSSGVFVEKRQVQLGDNHIVWGNRTRFLRGLVDIRPDAEWLTHGKLLPRLIVEAMTWPWMRRYRYSSRIRATSKVVESGSIG